MASSKTHPIINLYSILELGTNNTAEICCIINLFMSFCTIFLYVILGWYQDNCWWKLSKQTFYWSKTVFFFLSEKSKQYFHSKLSWYHPKITDANILQKELNRFNVSSKKVLCNHFSASKINTKASPNQKNDWLHYLCRQQNKTEKSISPIGCAINDHGLYGLYLL